MVCVRAVWLVHHAAHLLHFQGMHEGFFSMIWWPAVDRVLAAFSLSLVLSRDIFWLIFVLFLVPVVFAFLFSFLVPWEAVGFSAAYTHKLVVLVEVVMPAVSLAVCIAVEMVLLEA